ncbi:MAG: Fic family protein [Rothia mucilaginosa]|jgi:bacterial regulatory protein|uniref:Fic family protein n=2 Tax=Rothia TaxID=32207 RepID=A0A930KUA1_9MICC|nr:Fic family protein [Rothia mucilaginosa]MBF1650812.1 Fic family protein [Rothia dentocariosa]MBF1657885.1 Fic family protein [Rothia mucilaginosa]MBS5102794.1 Fic family protein [Rothia mucilaginosa]
MSGAGNGYRTLKSIFHERGEATAQAELQARRNGYSTYLIDTFKVGNHPLFYLVDRAALASFERIMKRERRIGQLSSRLPRAAMTSYLLDLTVRSIVATDRIEGVHTTRQIISDALATGDSEDPRAKRAVEFTSLLTTLGDRQPPATVEEVRKLYDTLLEGYLDDKDHLDGELFRTGPVRITNGTKDVHIPPVGEKNIIANIEVALAHALDPQASALFSAIIAHFMVEYTHPFYDGNGRFGRYLLANHMAQVLSHLTALTLPSTLNLHKKQYYKAFSVVEEPYNYGEATSFLHTFLQMTEKAQEYLEKELKTRYEALKSLRERVRELEQDREWLQGEDPKTQKQVTDMLKLLHLLGQTCIFRAPVAPTSSNLEDALDVTAPTLRDRLKLLQGLGFVEGVKVGRTRRWSLTEAGTALLGLPAVDDDED